MLVQRCIGGSTDFKCKVAIGLTEAVLACEAVMAQATCIRDKSCEWDAASSSCAVSGHGGLLAFQKLGSTMASTWIAQKDKCEALKSQKTCLSETIPASPTTGRSGTSTSGSTGIRNALSVAATMLGVLMAVGAGVVL